MSTCKLLHFPIKQHQVTQRVHEGIIWYIYVMYYTALDNQWEPVYFWARDDEDAQHRMSAICRTAKFGGRLKDNVEPAPVRPNP